MTLQDRFDALPVDFQSESLRDACAEHDAALAKHEDVEQRLAVAHLAVEDARGGVVPGLGSTWDALLAAGMLQTAVELVAPRFPAPSVVCVPGVTADAGDALQAALATIPADPTLSGELEVAAYASWPLHWRALGDSPIELPAELALADSLRDWRHEATDVARAVASWNTPQLQSDSIEALERAVSLLCTIGEIASRGGVVVEQVRAANEQRIAAGLEWDAQPKSIPNSDAFTSPELRALAKYRAAREAVPV